MRFMMASAVAVVLGVMAWTTSGPQLPQPIVPHVAGVVIDAEGAILPGATVELISGGRVIRTTTTDRNGAFTFDNVPQGSYELRTSLAGFMRATNAITIAPGPQPPLRLTLQVAAMAEAVTVRQDSKARSDALANAPPQ